MLLPEEIENQQFEVSFRGYNTREVDEFLNKLRSDAEDQIKELELLKRKVAAAELIAKDAKDHEEEFIASIQDDKDKADSILAAAKAEGERIIREAKNAASGIMAEVRRRAGDISSESRKASSDIIEAAQAEAEELRTSAKNDADSIIKNAEASASKKLFTAQTEADNILRAAAVEAKAMEDEARKNAEASAKNAAESASLYEEYVKEVRLAAEKLCFEIDAELKNSAARIAILGKRISAAEIPEKPEAVPDAVEEVKTSAPEPEPETPSHAVPAHASAESVLEDTAGSSENEVPVGYFSREYKQAMSELFGDEDVTYTDSFPEDDDTYDYLDHVQLTDNTEDDIDGDDDDDDEDDGIVTSEYSDIVSAGKSADTLDIFADDALDRIYKSPSQEDIDDILNA